MKNRCQLAVLIIGSLCLLGKSFAEDELSGKLESVEEDYLLKPEHEQAIIEQNDFFDKHNPASLLKNNSTPIDKVKMNAFLDLSQFSDEVVEVSGIPVVKSPKRYNQPQIRWDPSRTLPSLSGPTGLLDSISARGLPKSRTAASYQYSTVDVDQANLFRNVRDHESIDSNFSVNHGIHQNFELSLRVNKTSRFTETTIGSRFDASQHGFPEYTYGLKAHQNFGKNAAALGFLATSIERASRNLILDQDFERYRTAYLTVTSPFTYRTESHVTIKHSSTDNKYVNNNQWFSYILGMDTKLTKDTHLLAEMKLEDLKAGTTDLVMNAGLRHRISDFFVDAYIMRGNQESYSETGFKISGAF